MASLVVLRVRAQLLLINAESWLRNFFSTSAQRDRRYRQSVNEEAFEAWMGWGPEFAAVISGRIEAARKGGRHDSVRFWQDVLISAHDFDSFPENRRKRDVLAPAESLV